jgi:hypothetical protein
MDPGTIQPVPADLAFRHQGTGEEGDSDSVPGDLAPGPELVPGQADTVSVRRRYARWGLIWYV